MFASVLAATISLWVLNNPHGNPNFPPFKKYIMTYPIDSISSWKDGPNIKILILYS